ncbi:MAG: GMC family oxidoreductase [Phycisphaerae bacterium]|nr:GMC family oxidoreductase [Phycisphaerae bacterium]MCZ2400867.1 GMC family oxidoreductase [Phycisphaerae bacterium]NUQ49577.1 GMC family oxidoreductase [Phycisphaerae bacterium]
MSNSHYDVIIIGAGAGGGTLARHLGPTGKRILMIERGTWLPRELDNWSTRAVVVDRKYETREVWKDKDGKPVHSNQHYNVGGNTKFWGAALFRFRERDFESHPTRDGMTVEWPVKYDVFAPYYSQVERLFDVHGRRGVDPTEPYIDDDYPFAPIEHEPRVQEIADALKARGLHPFHLPVAIRRDDRNPHLSACIRCNTCDAFPCLLHAKADAETNAVVPALASRNVTLLTSARAMRLVTNPSGRSVAGVECLMENGRSTTFTGDIVVVSCGAINSARLLLMSADDRHPHGLANSSGQVGRNYMYHLLAWMWAITGKSHDTQFEKTLGVNDFYWGEKGYAYPMGNIQNTGRVNAEMMRATLGKPVAGMTFEQMAERSTNWWIMTEDLPDPENRITLDGDTIRVSYTENNRESFDRLCARWIDVLRGMECVDQVVSSTQYLSGKVPVSGVAHQCGTIRFGTDPKTSVLDVNCKAHDLDNLYVVDSSFYPSSAALNPTNTIMANALRVGDHLMERMGVRRGQAKADSRARTPTGARR